MQGMVHGTSGDNTLNAIFQVLAWSFRILAHGTFPAKDHQGLDFTHPWRKKQANNALKIFGLLSEIRGDWEMYNNHIKCRFKIQSLIISSVTGKRRTFFSKLGYGLDFWLVALSAKDVGSVSL